MSASVLLQYSMDIETCCKDSSEVLTPVCRQIYAATPPKTQCPLVFVDPESNLQLDQNLRK